MLKQLYFFVKRCVFRIQEKVDNVRLLFPLSKSIWWVLATEVIKGLLYVWIVTGADAWLLTKTCNDAFKNDVFRDVVLGGMGIAGVILGLYCANLSSIFSSTYTNAPPSLANAYQRDLVTNKCIRNSIRYIVVCILFLLVCLIDIDIYWFASVFFLVMTLNVVITFSTVGNRSYALADSFRIADTLRIQIGRMMKKASFRGVISTDQNFQKHFMKISDHALNIIMDIARYNAEIPKAQNQAWRSFMVSNLALLLKYWNIKPTIYHDSLWFKDKAYYQQWHKASESEVRISTQAGVPLQPKYERDIWWLEDRILEINQIGLDKLIKDHDVRALCDYIHQLGKLSEIACKAKTLVYWADHLQCILEKLQSFIASIPKEEIDKQEELFAALAEGMCPVFIGMHVGINQEISSLNIDVLFGMITQYKSFNECDFSICSALNSAECEKLFRQIKTEFSIEGKRITPDWYIQQIVGYQIYKEYGSVLNVLENAAKCIFTFGEFLLEQKYSYMSSVVFVHYFNLRQKTLSIVPGIPSDTDVALLQTLAANGIIASTIQRNLPDGRILTNTIIIGYHRCWTFCTFAESFKDARLHTVLHITGIAGFIITGHHRANSLDELFVSERLMEGGKLNTALRFVLIIAGQHITVRLSFHRCQLAVFNNRHSIDYCVIGLARAGRAVKDGVQTHVCHWLIYFLLLDIVLFLQRGYLSKQLRILLHRKFSFGHISTSVEDNIHCQQV